VRGKLYTVNPIAVSSTFANVFTENKRAVCLIDSPEFGRVAFVAVGATMVRAEHGCSKFVRSGFALLPLTSPVHQHVSYRPHVASWIATRHRRDLALHQHGCVACVQAPHVSL